MTERRVAEGLPRLELDWPTVVAGITTREIDFGGATDTPSRAAGAARATLRTWAADRFHGLIGGSQVHGARLYAADRVEVPEDDGAGGPWALRLAGYDGFLTARPGILLTVSVADCVPAVLWSEETGAVALLHAGWRGVAAAIVPRALTEMAERYGARAAGLRAWWGPAIGPCCYEVGEEVVEALAATAAGGRSEEWLSREGPRPRVDLRAALTVQAQAAGIESSAIEASTRCTACEPELLHSYRREAGGGGRMMAFAGVPGDRVRARP